VRLLTPPPDIKGPLVVFLNHASWWDPMVCLLLRKRFFNGRNSFAPIDASALEKYSFFKRLGFFPVEKDSARGAASFLRHGAEILSQPDSAMWLTPQGDFRDARERPVGFRGGLAHLAQRVPTVTLLPLAIEYVFWEERLPEICVSFGEPVVAGRDDLGVDSLTGLLENRLQHAQDELAFAVIHRDTERLNVLDRRSSGVGGIYDFWRHLKSLARGRQFQPEHGSK